jgi:hypothetical protein
MEIPVILLFCMRRLFEEMIRIPLDALVIVKPSTCAFDTVIFIQAFFPLPLIIVDSLFSPRNLTALPMMMFS